MEKIKKPIKFEQFLIVQKFQYFFKLVHFRCGRDKNGKLINESKRVFQTVVWLHVSYFAPNIYDILRSMSLGVPNQQNLPVLSIAVYLTLRGLMMFIKRNDLMDFLIILDREFPKDLTGQRLMKIPEVYANYLYRHKYVAILVQVGLVFFLSAPTLFYILSINLDRNATITQDHQLLGGWMPFGLRLSHRAYPFIWVYDAMSVLSAVALYTSFDALFYTMHGQIIMHLNYLSERIKEVKISSSDASDSQLYDQLSQLINRHQYLNSLCDKFSDIFKCAILLTDFIAATSICFHLYLITETQDMFLLVKYSLPCFGMVLFTFELSFRGSQLEEASDLINESLYNQTWFSGNKKIRQLILIWLKYTQCTKKIRAYGLMEVNMIHFSEILKLTYRLFTFLKSRN